MTTVKSECEREESAFIAVCPRTATLSARAGRRAADKLAREDGGVWGGRTAPTVRCLLPSVST